MELHTRIQSFHNLEHNTNCPHQPRALLCAQHFSVCKLILLLSHSVLTNTLRMAINSFFVVSVDGAQGLTLNYSLSSFKILNFQIGSCSVAQVGFKLVVILSLIHI